MRRRAELGETARRGPGRRHHDADRVPAPDELGRDVEGDLLASADAGVEQVEEHPHAGRRRLRIRAGRNERTSGRRTSESRKRAPRREPHGRQRAPPSGRPLDEHVMRRREPAQEAVARPLALRRREVRQRREVLLGDANRPLGRAPPADVARPDAVLRGGAVRVQEAPAEREAQVEIPVLVRVERLVEAADALERAAPHQRRRREHRAVAGERRVRRPEPLPVRERRALRRGLLGQRRAALVDHLRRAVDERRVRIVAREGRRRGTSSCPAASGRPSRGSRGTRRSRPRRRRCDPRRRSDRRRRPAPRRRAPRARRRSRRVEPASTTITSSGGSGAVNAERTASTRSRPRSRVGMMTLTPLDIRGRTSLRARCVRQNAVQSLR